MAKGTHRAALFEKKGGAYVIKEVDTPSPGPHEVLLKVSASGICHSDGLAQAGIWPGAKFPLVPGHEVIGHIAEIGPDVNGDLWKKGQLVGVGWHGFHCQACTFCRKGDFAGCEHETITGITSTGGHQEYVVMPETSLVTIPETDVPHAELAPLLCAGITVYEAIKQSNYTPGDLCLIVGIGGLGHLGIGYASKLGLRTVAVSSGPGKSDLARGLGAVDAWESKDVVEKAQALGGAKVIICTAPSKQAVEAVLPAAGRDCSIVLVGLPDDGAKIEIDAGMMVAKRAKLVGWSCGSASANEQTIKFSLLAGVTATVKTFKLDDIQKAFDEVMTGKPHFRNVIVFD